MTIVQARISITVENTTSTFRGIAQLQCHNKTTIFICDADTTVETLPRVQLNEGRVLLKVLHCIGTVVVRYNCNMVQNKMRKAFVKPRKTDGRRLKTAIAAAHNKRPDPTVP
jgi:hypothetical protein